MFCVETTSMHVTLRVDKSVPVILTDIFFFTYASLYVVTEEANTISDFSSSNFFHSCRVPWPQYVTFVVVVAMDEHCCLEDRFMRVRSVEVLSFSISALTYDIAMTKTAVLPNYKGIYGRRYLTYTKWNWSPVCTVLRQDIPVAYFSINLLAPGLFFLNFSTSCI